MAYSLSARFARELTARYLGLSLILLLVAARLPAEEGAKKPWSGMPSSPGEHIAKIKAMPADSWLELGAPAPDERYGRARGRSWTAHMPHVDSLRGAFLYGEGVHGYAKPDGHYMDDLWLYDINAHRWVCCYPGAPTKTLDLKVNDDGFEVDAKGQIVAVAQQVHGYEMNAYDPESRRFVSMPNTHSYCKNEMPQRATWHKPAPEKCSPWFFDLATGGWDRKRTETTSPGSGYGDTLVYIPTLKEFFFAHRSQEVWFYNPAKNSWREAKAKGPTPPFGIDAVACYETRRDRVYMGGGSYPISPPDNSALWVYDVKTNRWLDPKPHGQALTDSNSFPTKNALLNYDVAADKVLLVMHSHHDDQALHMGVYVYDPERNAWDEKRRELPKKLATNAKQKMASTIRRSA